jgi:hypothetical protein
MSLNNLQLPASLLPDLYPNTLVQSTEAMTTRKEKKNIDAMRISFLGGNEKKITIVIAEAKQAYMSDADLEWLQKMLFACKLSLGDVAIVNLHTKMTDINLIKQQLHPAKLIMLGPAPSELELPLNFPMFKLQQHDDCIYLHAPSPAELNQETRASKEQRLKLWTSLQQLFEL